MYSHVASYSQPSAMTRCSYYTLHVLWFLGWLVIQRHEFMRRTDVRRSLQPEQPRQYTVRRHTSAHIDSQKLKIAAKKKPMYSQCACVDGVFELSSWRAFQRTFYFVNIPSTDIKSTFRYPSFSGTAIRDFGS